jgi:hypothetical protein
VERVVLDLVYDSFVLGDYVVDFVVVFQLISFDVFVVLFYGAVDHVALEIVLLVAFFDEVDGVLHGFFFLAEFAGVDDHEVLVEVEFADVVAEAAHHGEGERELLFHFLFDVAVDFVLEEVLPTHAVFGVGFEHFAD